LKNLFSRRLCSGTDSKVFFSFFAILFAATASAQSPDYFSFFDSCKVTGSFVLYNNNDSSSFEIDAQRCQKRFTPASTFKILNSLIALETGAVKDEKTVIKWDSVERPVKIWNQDLDMKHAFKYSAVWFYQELARRIGETKMKKYIQLCSYGNMDISGGIDQFWLTGNLKISQYEQIGFLKNLYDNELPFSAKTMNTVKDIMLMEDTLGYKLYAKTGWGQTDSLDIGWYVGWVETKNNVYFFATNIEAVNPDPEKFPAARIKITKDILKEMGILPK
jgi:beta-lactamase class D